MKEKEIKKLDEESVEKISGGTKVDGPEKVEKDLEGAKITKTPFPMLAYGVIKPYDIDIVEILKKRREETKKNKDSKDALTPSSPQTEEKK